MWMVSGIMGHLGHEMQKRGPGATGWDPPVREDWTEVQRPAMEGEKEGHLRRPQGSPAWPSSLLTNFAITSGKLLPNLRPQFPFCKQGGSNLIIL